MTLPPDFQFSQSNLQDYVDCARRFELRYLERLLWPAVETEPIAEHERHMQRGSDFHHLVHQHLIGLPMDVLTASITDDELRGWWHSYLDSGFLDSLPENRYPELPLSMPFAGKRLLAKYDLIAIEPGKRVVIVDWKSSQRKTSRQRLQDRLQTHVYPYVLAHAGAHLNGGTPIQPEQIEMVYWFTADPDNPERFEYGIAQHMMNANMLEDLAGEIERRSVFDLTTDTRQCRFCTYRSLCNRGIQAGDVDEVDLLNDAGDDLDFDFDQIMEVEF